MAGPGLRSIGEIFIRHGADMIARARRILGSDADAEDAVQEVMLSLLVAPHLLTVVERISGWLMTLVKRRAVDFVRSGARRRRREIRRGVEEMFADAPDPAALMEKEEIAGIVAAAVDELPDPLRQAFCSNALDGVTFRELSQRTGVPEGTLMARKKEAVDSIRAQLRSRGLLP